MLEENQRASNKVKSGKVHDLQNTRKDSSNTLHDVDEVEVGNCKNGGGHGGRNLVTAAHVSSSAYSSSSAEGTGIFLVFFAQTLELISLFPGDKKLELISLFSLFNLQL